MTRRSPRPAALHGAWLAFLGSVALFAVLVALLLWPSGGGGTTGGPIVVYCAAGIKPAVEPVAREYERQYGVEVRLDYAGSQSLLTRLIEGRDAADLYLPADESYVRAGHERGLLAETVPLARIRPVLAVAAGNPKKIAALDDLLRPDVRLALADPDVAAIGKVTRDALTRSGRWDAIQAHIAVSKPTVTDVANAVQLGAVDAGFVWDASVRQVGGLEVVPLPQLGGVSSLISVAVVSGCRQTAAALRFARFLAARDRGLPEFEKNGFEPVDGDPWDESPQLVLYGGAMLRPAVEETIKDFEQREGVQVVTVYNGCGILVSQMRTRGERPDAYFACDKSFMDMVSDLFVDAADVSTNRLVILVKKGNPHGIKALDDLGRPGLRVGVGHEKQCALGVLTQKALEQGRVKADVMKNVRTQLPAGDMLVNDMLAGALDAVVAYVSNKTGHDDELEAIPIDVPCAVAVQPVAVGRESRHRQLTQRLLAALRSGESQMRFEASGFHWRATEPPSPLGGEGGQEAMSDALPPDQPPRRVATDIPFLLLLAVIGGLYVVLIAAMLAADVSFLMRDAPGTPQGKAESLLRHFATTLGSAEIRYAIRLSLVSCTLTAILSLWVAVPLGYLMSRYRFRGKWLLDALLDIPIVLPPLVIGLSLLILFHLPLGGQTIEQFLQERLHFSVTYAVPSVVLAQFAVACAFAVRTMRVTFDGLSPRHEQVALTLGCSRAQAFWRVVLPSARRGMVTAATLAWARALGEFGPILVFSGATRMRTEVLPTTVFLELSVGNLEAAVAVSLLMVLAAVIVLVVVRVYGMDAPAAKLK